MGPSWYRSLRGSCISSPPAHSARVRRCVVLTVSPVAAASSLTPRLRSARSKQCNTASARSTDCAPDRTSVRPLPPGATAA